MGDILLAGIDIGTTNCKVPDSHSAAYYNRCYREVYQQFTPVLAQAQPAIGELGLESA